MRQTVLFCCHSVPLRSKVLHSYVIRVVNFEKGKAKILSFERTRERLTLGVVKCNN